MVVRITAAVVGAIVLRAVQLNADESGVLWLTLEGLRWALLLWLLVDLGTRVEAMSKRLKKVEQDAAEAGVRLALIEIVAEEEHRRLLGSDDIDIDNLQGTA